jgi:K+-sensing histidine kinase KdpD
MTDQEFTELLSELAHDLRTPLTSIRGFADVLITAGERLTEADRTDFARRIKTAATQLDELISSLATKVANRVSVPDPDTSPTAPPP